MPAPKTQSPLGKEVYDVGERSERSALIELLALLQRIKAADDRDKVIDYEIRVVLAKLEGYGNLSEDLTY